MTAYFEDQRMAENVYAVEWHEQSFGTSEWYSLYKEDRAEESWTEAGRLVRILGILTGEDWRKLIPWIHRRQVKHGNPRRLWGNILFAPSCLKSYIILPPVTHCCMYNPVSPPCPWVPSKGIKWPRTLTVWVWAGWVIRALSYFSLKIRCSSLREIHADINQCPKQQR
jgi:hypothetical protein